MFVCNFKSFWDFGGVADSGLFVSKCIYYWPEDGRAYVALGKILGKQSKVAEARAVYEKGCQATQGENPYIWQVTFLFST